MSIHTYSSLTTRMSFLPLWWRWISTAMEQSVYKIMQLKWKWSLFRVPHSFEHPPVCWILFPMTQIFQILTNFLGWWKIRPVRRIRSQTSGMRSRYSTGTTTATLTWRSLNRSEHIGVKSNQHSNANHLSYRFVYFLSEYTFFPSNTNTR